MYISLKAIYAVSLHDLTVAKFQLDLLSKVQDDLIRTEGVMLKTRSKIGNQGYWLSYADDSQI